MKTESKEHISTFLLNDKIKDVPVKSELNIVGPVLKLELKTENAENFSTKALVVK